MSRFDVRTVGGQRYQSTGYHDREGREIYAGDTVAWTDSGDENSSEHTIVWGEFHDCCVNGETWMLDPSPFDGTVYTQQKYLRIIDRPGEEHE